MNRKMLIRRLTLVGAAAMTMVIAGVSPASAANERCADGKGSAGATTYAPCNLPTAATPPSRFIRSFSDCGVCIVQATRDTENLPGGPYYCTYNPRNGMSDEHQYLG